MWVAVVIALEEVTCEEDGTNVMDTLRGISVVGTRVVIVDLGVEHVISSLDPADTELVD